MELFLEILKAIAIGVVQGITEWLPISSTAHMALFDRVLGLDMTPEVYSVFEVVVQLGSILAVIVLYFAMLNPFAPSKTREEKSGTWSLWLKILVASIPAAVVGFAIDDVLDAWLQGRTELIVIAAALIVYGVAFIVMERLPKKERTDSVDKLSYKTVLGIGAFQMLALIPGTSRSGSTILGASLLGCSRKTASEFSFFMAIPVMVGASGLRLVKYVAEYGLHFSVTEWISMAVATVVAFAVSLLVIRFLLSFIRKHSFVAFGWYRIAVGIAVLACAFLFF